MEQQPLLEHTRIDVDDEMSIIRARRAELGHFLRQRRTRLLPSDVEFKSPGRRHVRGLRRDEVASLAAIGVTWYTMLEQGRVENVSLRTLLAVARALRFSGPEREHLFALAAGSFEELNVDATPPPAALIRFIEHATLGMAFIVSARFDIVAFNDPADLFFRIRANGPDPNLLRIMFGDQSMRARFIDPTWENVAAQMVGHFRLGHARAGGVSFDPLIAELKKYPEFASLWDARGVMAPPAERSTLCLPDVAPFTVNVMAFTSFVCPTYTIIFKTRVEPEQLPQPKPAVEALVRRSVFAGSEKQRRIELGAFLRHKRERTLPQDIGLITVGRRHAKGLRREEVADRAGIGVSWYTMLEQGRVENVTHRTLRKVADTLAMTHRERLYLEQLSSQSFTEFAGFQGTAGADLLQLVRSFPDGHAHFHDSHFDMLAWNAVADEFYGFSSYEKPNLLQVMVRNSHLKSQFIAPNWDEALNRMLSHYRFNHVLFMDSESESMISELVTESPAFARLWLGDRTVQNPAVEPGILRYPRSGERVVDVLVLAPTTLPTHTLLLKIPCRS